MYTHTYRYTCLYISLYLSIHQSQKPFSISGNCPNWIWQVRNHSFKKIY